jgi:hypothetical protein
VKEPAYLLTTCFAVGAACRAAMFWSMIADAAHGPSTTRKKILFGLAAVTLVAIGSPAKAQMSGGIAISHRSGGSKAPAVQGSDAAAPAADGRSSQASGSFQRENPTGLPSYEMRPDGLMINGLLPANGWQG